MLRRKMEKKLNVYYFIEYVLLQKRDSFDDWDKQLRMMRPSASSNEQTVAIRDISLGNLHIVSNFTRFNQNKPKLSYEM